MSLRLLLASGNAGKLREFRAILGALGALVESAGSVEYPEEGDDYEANARAKALAAAQQCGVPALADDSGIEVMALGWAPGPRSARYGGPGLDDRGRLVRLLAQIEQLDDAERVARFVCVAALALPDGTVATARGVCPGILRREVVGAGGFGYDPIFQPDGFECTMAELDAEEKNRISHRGQALRELWLAVDDLIGSGS